MFFVLSCLQEYRSIFYFVSGFICSVQDLYLNINKICISEGECKDFWTELGS